MNTITVQLTKNEKERLSRLALQYGFSLKDFAQRIIQEVSSEIAEESFSDYKNSRELKRSLNRAIKNYHRGRFYTSL